MIDIIPAILTADSKELEEKLKQIEGRVQSVQIDIVDGMFVQNRTIFPDLLEKVDTNLLIDFHLMTKEPIDWVEHCIRGMADRIFGHIEQMTSQPDFVGKVQEVGAKVGLALDLGTPISAIDAVLFQNLDAILVMSTKAGFGGGEFDRGVLEKIRKLDQIRIRDDTPFRICVDGGINEDNIKEVVAAGADEVAVGRMLFEGDLVANIKRLQGVAYGKD